MAALPAHRAVVCALRGRPPRAAQDVRRGDRRPHRDPLRQRQLHVDGARRSHRVPCGRAYAILDYKTGARRPNRKCVPDCRRSSRSKPPFCATAVSGTFAPAARSTNCSTCGCAAAPTRRGNAHQVQGRHARRASRPRARRADQTAAAIRRPAEPYYSLLHPMWKTHYGTYDHLARVQEWSLTGGASDDGGGE